MDYSKCRKGLGINLDENLAGKNPNPTAKGAYPIATLTWILAYETGNGRNTKTIQQIEIVKK